MGTIDASGRRRFARRMASVFALGLLLRLGYLAADRFALPPDTDGYVRISANLAAGQGFSIEPGVPTAYRPPAYPVFLALFQFVPGGLHLALLLQCIAASSVAVVAGQIARRLSGDTAGVACAAIVAVDPYQIAASGWFMTEALFSLFVVAFVALVVRAAGNVRAAGAAGLIAGLGFLTRPEFALFVPAALALVLLGRSRPIVCALAFLACLVVFPAAWTARNAISLGKPVAATTHGGYTHRLPYNFVFYDRVVRSGRDAWAGRDESFESWSARVAAETGGMNELARDAHNSRMANAFIIADPARAFRVALYGAASFWRPWPRRTGPVQSVTLGAFFLALVALAVTGIVILGWKEPFVPVVLYMLAAETLAHMYYWSNVRMRVPFQPVLAVCAGCAIAVILGLRRPSATAGKA